MNKTKKITLKELQTRIQFLEQTEAYKPITLAKKAVAYTMIGIGTITLPAPTGSVFLIIAGCALLSIDSKKLMRTINFYAKETAYWVLRQARRMTKA